MAIKTNAKVNKSNKTNTTVNIPKIMADALELQHKDSVSVELKGNKIIIEKEGK